ncbi:unnamed protein product [Microthlaspi erraticum]|uniref:F-box domain-containing protein n=1 Tax=Microthlaspi erraticum TaxID=1685480 RepID=A0A6D2KAH0_9BRAS|nr:unnamed protein product [Microthlaspi erraticum]
MEKSEQHFSENLSITSGNETQSHKSVRRTHADPIPVDLLIDIFSRVPKESIARFRCVSKLWEYTVGFPDFTDLYLSKSFNRPRLLFTLKSDGKLLFYSAHQPHNPYMGTSHVATRYHTSSSSPKYVQSGNCTLVCGLALLQGDYNRTKRKVICNPITGKLLTLPKVVLKSKTLPDIEEAYVARFYFGYDPISKQFKVLCMTSSLCKRPNTHQVLTLESGKRFWRRIEQVFDFMEDGITRDGICIDGVLYFGGDVGDTSVIVCFDVRSEKFHFINLDKEMKYSSEYGSLTLFNYKGKLGLHQRITRSRHMDRDVDRELVLWVVEDAANHKWSKKTYKMYTSITEKSFVGMTARGEIVWSSYSDDNKSKLYYVHFYNLERESFTSVHIQGFEEFNYPSVDTFIDYVENLKFM